MQFQIREIIIWPKKAQECRRLIFDTARLNIISGVSRTGKSAIIPIIDYCLGADKCTIPVQTIRDAAAWFGILIETNEGQRLLARREPGLLRASSDMYVEAGPQVKVPDRIPEKSTSVDTVKQMLNDLSGLSNLSFEPGVIDAGYRTRPSFRDLVSFLFQPQNIIANPNVLFYKADTADHREKLRTIFPYVLGAVTPQILARRHELDDLHSKLRRKENELRSAQQVSANWLAQVKARVSEARELGLLPPHGEGSLTINQAIDLLRSVVVRTPDDAAGATSSTISNAVEELTRLQQEETRIAHELERVRHRYAEMAELRQNTTAYGNALHTQADRLQIARWIGNLDDVARQCPICRNPMKSDAELNKLTQALESIEKSAERFATMPTSFDREFERVRKDISEHTERLRGIRVRINSLTQTSDDAKARQYSLLASERFRGMLASDLKMFERLGQEGDLLQEVEELRQRVRDIEQEIAEADIKKRLENALAIITANAARIIPTLDVERPDDPIALGIEDLTLRIKGADRDDFLSEIGSGSNWLAYHLALLLSIHEFFLRTKEHPVPNFLVIDQPSQVYFPRQLVERSVDGGTETERIYQDDDVVALQKDFQALAASVARTKGKLQIIVLDHAAESVWGKIAGVHEVEDWRNGKKLIPEEWLR
jgi:uncharacterized coiled-coil DUF342 family protein